MSKRNRRNRSLGPEKSWHERFVGKIIVGVIIGIVLILFGSVFRKHIFSESMPQHDESVKKIFENSFPIKIGYSREKVREIFGQPQESELLSDTFYSEGVSVFYDRHEMTVDGLVFRKSPSGIYYDGKIYGIGIGDKLVKTKERFGAPAHWGIPTENTSIAIWKKENKLLIATNNIDSGDGGVIESITLSKESSFANYLPILFATILEFKSNIRPSLIEEHDFIFIKENTKFFYQKYAVERLMVVATGGAVAHLKFENGVKLYVWIYPYSWERPRVRMIAYLDAMGNPILPPRKSESKIVDEEILNAVKGIMKVESGSDSETKRKYLNISE